MAAPLVIPELLTDAEPSPKAPWKTVEHGLAERESDVVGHLRGGAVRCFNLVMIARRARLKTALSAEQACFVPIPN